MRAKNQEGGGEGEQVDQDPSLDQKLFAFFIELTSVYERTIKSNHPTNRWASSVALWPPKPKELLIAISTRASRAL